MPYPHSWFIYFLHIDIDRFCEIVTVCAFICNFLPPVAKFRRYPRFAAMYTHFIDIVAGFAFNWRHALPSLNLEFMGFQVQRHSSHTQMELRFIERRLGDKQMATPLDALKAFSLSDFLAKYSTLTHIVLVAWNAFIATWATKGSVVFYGITFSASDTVSWLQLNWHLPTWTLGLLTFALNIALVYHNWRTSQAKELDAAKRLGLPPSVLDLPRS